MEIRNKIKNEKVWMWIKKYILEKNRGWKEGVKELQGIYGKEY